jgi:outer membrane protein
MDERKIATMFMFFALSLPLTAQSLSLKQCIEYAKQNNSNIKIASLNSEVSGKLVNEQIGNALPQIDFDGSLTNNFIVATSLLPAEFIGGEPGTFIPVKMGTRIQCCQYDTADAKDF